MAAFNAKDTQVTINSVDLKDHAVSVTIDRSWETSDKSAMGDTARTSTLGLRVESVSASLIGDYASSKTYATLNALFVAGTSHDVLVIPVDTTVAPTNPSFTFTGYIDSYPLNFQLGETNMDEVTWTNNAAAGITIATS